MNEDIAIDGTMDLSKRSPLEAPATINESALRNIIRECMINMFENLDEKAKSKAQQRFMGMVHAVQKGDLDADEVGASVAKAAKTMKKKDAKDFAETKHKGLPNHVDESTFQDLNDMDNYSGEYSRGDRYDIYIDGQLEYHDVPEEAVDRICASWEKKPYDVDIDVKRLNESCDGEHPYCGEKKDMEDAEKNSPDKPMDFNKKQKGISINENDLISLIKESVQEELVDVLAKYVKGEATAEEANKAIMNLANSSNMKMNESLDPKTANYFEQVKMGERDSLDYNGQIYEVTPQLRKLAQQISEQFGLEVYPYVYQNDVRIFCALLMENNGDDLDYDTVRVLESELGKYGLHCASSFGTKSMIYVKQIREKDR